MMYDPGSLSSALAQAVGDDAALVAELRAAFRQSALELIAQLARSSDEASWRDTALRLKGLAASFGATGLVAMADTAAESRRDAAVLRLLTAAIDPVG